MREYHLEGMRVLCCNRHRDGCPPTQFAICIAFSE